MAELDPDGLSVVIPFYGDLRPTLKLIDSLRQQTGTPELQIIVSDDCSPTPFPEGEGYEVIRRTTNGGFGGNVNTGMARARYSYAIILNSDIEMEPGALAAWWGHRSHGCRR